MLVVIAMRLILLWWEWVDTGVDTETSISLTGTSESDRRDKPCDGFVIEEDLDLDLRTVPSSDFVVPGPCEVATGKTGPDKDTPVPGRRPPAPCKPPKPLF